MKTIPSTALILFLTMAPLGLAETLNVGSINRDSPAKEIAKFYPIAKYLAHNLKDEGYKKGKVVVAPNILEMSKLVEDGKVDIYIDSPFPVIAVSQLSPLKLLLRRWKKGTAEYHSVIFSRKEGGISSLDDLKGKVIAFEDPYSSSGYLLPKFVLQNKGFSLVRLSNALEKVPEDKIGYLFTGSDESIMVWTKREKVDAGVLSNKDYKKFTKRHKEKMLELLRTEAIPRQILAVRKSLPAELIAKVKSILVDMESSQEGKKTLKEFEKTKRFDEIPPGLVDKLISEKDFFAEEFGEL